MPELLLHPKVTEEIRTIQHRLQNEGRKRLADKMTAIWSSPARWPRE